MDSTPLSESDSISITEEPDYRYGPQIRVIKNNKKEAKIEAKNLDKKQLIVYEHTPRWALEAVLDNGYKAYYIHNQDSEIESYSELMDAVDEEYDV